MLKLLFAVLILVAAAWLVSRYALRVVPAGSAERPESASGRILASPSPFAITFRDQYLCRDDADRWRMFGEADDPEAMECSGPYIDSQTLCRALQERGERQVKLFWEGRLLRCP